MQRQVSVDLSSGYSSEEISNRHPVGYVQPIPSTISSSQDFRSSRLTHQSADIRTSRANHADSRTSRADTYTTFGAFGNGSALTDRNARFTFTGSLNTHNLPKIAEQVSPCPSQDPTIQSIWTKIGATANLAKTNYSVDEDIANWSKRTIWFRDVKTLPWIVDGIEDLAW